MRITDDHGKSLRKPEGARPVTDDGRLIWVGPILPHERHEFFLDGVNLGCITLEQAMKTYRAHDVICSRDDEPIELIVKPGEEK